MAQEEASKVSAIKHECEADLAEAMPAFNAALKVGEKEDFALTSLANPCRKPRASPPVTPSSGA